jgi:glycosyltransferase involved in cell wall biosynthesis
MRILYISNEYPPETGFGGIGTYTKNAAAGMASLGHDVHVICRSDSGEKRRYVDGAVTVHRAGAGTYPLPEGRLWYPVRSACRALLPETLIRLAWAKQACATLRGLQKMGERFDIVEFPECGAEGYYVAKHTTALAVVRLHTPWKTVAALDAIHQRPLDGALMSCTERAAARAARAVTSPTQSLASLVRKQWGISDITVYPNPIPVSEYALSEGSEWIYLGRVERRKGVHILLSAYANLCKSIDPPRLRIVGRPFGPWEDGREYGDYIDGLIRKSQIARKVEWIRGTDHDSVKDLLRRSSVAVLPSLWENFSYSCLEAMASGCAVVASRCGGFEEIFRDGENGVLFPAGNTEALTQALYRLYKQEDIRKRIGCAARAYVTRYCDTPVVSRQIEACYMHLLGGNPNG